MTAKNSILNDLEAEESTDELLASLENLAYSVPNESKTLPLASGRASRFFFKPTLNA